MSMRINRIELNGRNDNPSLAVFMYSGNQDPVEQINEAISRYVEDHEFYEFVDINMDNPWTRVVLKDINGFEKFPMNVEGRTFDLYRLHDSENVKVFYIRYLDGVDDRPYPIMDLAVMQFANRHIHNTYIDSNISDLWSRLIIIGINEITQEEFNNQKI